MATGPVQLPQTSSLNDEKEGGGFFFAHSRVTKLRTPEEYCKPPSSVEPFPRRPRMYTYVSVDDALGSLRTLICAVCMCSVRSASPLFCPPSRSSLFGYCNRSDHEDDCGLNDANDCPEVRGGGKTNTKAASH